MKRSISLRIAAAVLVLLVAGFFVGRAAADQPHMQAALDSLRSARRHLEEATSDKGGHRSNALRHVREAIDEVEKGDPFRQEALTGRLTWRRRSTA